METTLVVVGCAVMGLVIGSFLTVVVDRVPRGASIVAPPSACGSCGLELRRTRPGAGAELAGTARQVPAVRGTDRYRADRHRARERRDLRAVRPSVRRRRGTAGVLHLRRGARGADLDRPARVRRLPREITYTAIVLGSIALMIAALVDDEPRRIWTMVFGAGLALAIMGGIYLGSRGGLGEGDVRLAPLLGLYLGWLNLGSCLSACSSASCSEPSSGSG